MSWSTSASGKAADVAKTVAETLAGYKCSEPEETIKAKVADVITTALGAYPADAEVKVSAYGSQHGADENGKAINTLSISIAQ